MGDSQSPQRRHRNQPGHNQIKSVPYSHSYTLTSTPLRYVAAGDAQPLDRSKSMEYRVEFVDGYFDVKLIGKSSVEGSAAYLDYLITHPQWKPGSLVLSDETNIEIGHIAIDDLKKMAPRHLVWI